MNFLFHSAQADAPVLSGTVGALDNLLFKCLVDGYGAVAIGSMTRVGSVVTVTTGSAHAFGDLFSPVQISGANETAYNGTWRVTEIVSATVFKFDLGVATPATPATGTMSVKRAPMGWTRAFTGSNKSAYKQPAGTNGFYLRVDDSAPAATTARQAIARGYEAMTDVDTGTAAFPLAAQAANGIGVVKSVSADSTARAWRVYADHAAFYLFVNLSGTVVWHLSLHFGDGRSFKPGDQFDTAMIGCDVNTGTTQQNLTTGNSLHTASNVAQTNHYKARSYSQSGGSVPFWKIGDYHGQSNSDGFGGSGMPGLSNPVDNGVYVSRIRTVESGPAIAGTLPGVFSPLANQPLSQHATLDNVLGLTGSILMAQSFLQGGSSGALNINQLLFDLTGAWR